MTANAQEARFDSDLISGLCHAFGSAANFEELASFTATWTRAALGEGATVRIALPDRAGRLRIVWKNTEAPEVGRKRSARRREAFVSKRAQRLDPTALDGRSIALLPLVSRGEVFGVLEISGASRALRRRWGFLEALASQAAIAQANLLERGRLSHQVVTVGRVASLSLDLVRAQDPAAAVHLAVGFLAGAHGGPVAGWTSVSKPGRMELAAVRGLGSRRRHQLRGAMGELDRWSTLTARERRQIARRFRDLVDAADVAIVDAGEAVILAAMPGSSPASLKVVESALSGVLDQLAVTQLAERRNSQLDMGLAWTAHELRAPVLSVKAALELLLHGKHETEIDRVMLQRSLRELEHLAGTTEELLGWSVGARPLRRRPVDLVALVKEVAESREDDSADGRIKVVARGPVIANVDRMHVRGAINNILRNALIYSPPTHAIRVDVGRHEEHVTISIKNRGSFIPETERTSIFDPFVRGSLGRAQHGSTGLGLFIARRIIEAHGGEIWVESSRGQSTFSMQLPMETAGARRSAS